MPTLDVRFAEFLDALGLVRVHLASGYVLDAATLVRAMPERIGSVTLVSPMRFFVEPFRPLEEHLLFISGDRGPGADIVPGLLGELPHARSLRLANHVDATWSDTVADRHDEVLAGLRDFLGAGSDVPDANAHVSAKDGEVAGITYRIAGSGPPVVLLPLGLARSQWDPIVSELAQHYTVIVASGAFLGMVPTLESRMLGGYQTVVRNVVETARPRAGEKVLEVGCGSGAVARHLAQWTDATNAITGIDVNDYLLREAANLTRQQGLSDRITYQSGDAQSLPLPDAAFDVTLSFTVMEELDADRMMAELVRVTRPGGRIGVVVRAVDMAPWFNLDLPDEVRRAAQMVGGAGKEDDGCADASLYGRFVAAGLQDLVMGPQYGADTGARSPERLRMVSGRIGQALERGAAQQFREAVKRASSAGTMVWAEPYHCAVGTVPQK